jgi:hypothetical protein
LCADRGRTCCASAEAGCADPRAVRTDRRDNVSPDLRAEYHLPGHLPQSLAAPDLRTKDGSRFLTTRLIREGEELTVDYRTYGARILRGSAARQSPGRIITGWLVFTARHRSLAPTRTENRTTAEPTAPFNATYQHTGPPQSGPGRPSTYPRGVEEVSPHWICRHQRRGYNHPNLLIRDRPIPPGACRSGNGIRNRHRPSRGSTLCSVTMFGSYRSSAGAPRRASEVAAVEPALRAPPQRQIVNRCHDAALRPARRRR